MNDIPREGWRERKRRETRRRVWESALTLFGERGYEATTLDAIAEAAGISKRSFFHYFKSKEDVLAAWQDDVPTMFGAAVAAEPDGDTPIEVLRNVLAKLPAHFEPQQALLIDRIIRSNEQLRASNLAKLLRLEEAAFDALCQRWPDPKQRNDLRIASMIAIGALRVAIDRFAEEKARTPLVDLVQEMFARLAVSCPRG